MKPEILAFRNSCAEDGIELTPKEAKKFHDAYFRLREGIENAVAECPTFYLDLCNRTTEQKLEDIKRINRERDDNMTLKEYNELQDTVKKICEMEGYG
jgi:hypothetical protein